MRTHVEKELTGYHLRASHFLLNPEFFKRSWLVLPFRPPPFCLLRHHWKGVLPQPYLPPSPRITLPNADRDDQSAVRKVHPRLRSHLVSTFCCTPEDINHWARARRRKRPAHPPPLPEQERLISLMSRLLFGAIAAADPGPLRAIVLYQHPYPREHGLGSLWWIARKTILISLCHLNFLTKGIISFPARFDLAPFK